MGAYYDLERAIREAALPPETVQEILAEVRAEFPDDEMMYELHVIRALYAEASMRMTPDEWRQLQAAKVARFLAEGSMELRVTPPETLPRIVRKTKPE